MTKRSQHLATVKANTPLCREHFRLTLSLPSFSVTEPGQFVQLLCRPVDDPLGEQIELQWEPGSARARGAELLSPLAMLRRPFSLAARRDTSSGVELDVIHRVVGTGTQWLSELALGDSVSVIGPLGNQFGLPAPGGTGLLVAGGVGIPPMLYLAEKLKGGAVAFCGATSRDLLPFELIEDATAADAPAMRVAEFARHHVPAVVTTDDGSFGFRGFVTQALERYLDSNSLDPSTCVIYTCGPEPMMKRVAEIAISRGISCQVAVERAMACGMGTCQSCCIKVGKPDDWRYRLACTDGPIFAAGELLW
ncbi:MAG TPA: dihydroorotate dehydrogenase electron transfer subunit [Tepidisphaeraceae bacterium]|jgi:dihydroorotate dehydrogenase electron transfer subunit